MIPDKVKKIELEQIKQDPPMIEIGDTVKVHVKIVEEDKIRTQLYEGVIIRMRGEGMQRTITVRKVSYGEGVERIFPLHSPFVDKIQVTRHGKARRAKLYFLRDRVGKKTVLPERRK